MKNNQKKIYPKIIKRILDVSLSFAGIVALSPVFFSLFISSKICMGKNVIFKQNRMGENGKIFKIYKFRSMTNEKDCYGELLPDAQRVTKYGKFLRKTSLDELPQLLNILKGEMSIVGPRPHKVESMVFCEEEVLNKIGSVKPGLTGLSQINGGRGSANWDESFAFDCKYVENVGFLNDFKIFFKTFKVVFQGDAGDGIKYQREDFYEQYLFRHNLISYETFCEGRKLAKELVENNKKVVSVRTQTGEKECLIDYVLPTEKREATLHESVPLKAVIKESSFEK